MIASTSPTPRLHTFHRSARRLLRHPLMREVMAGNRFLAEAFPLFVQRFMSAHCHPQFVLLELDLMVSRALRMVERDRRPWALYKRLCDYMHKVLILMRGCLCGYHLLEPGSFCAICQSDEVGEWWFSMKCGHDFHVGCMFAHLAYDSRCPLCREEI